MRKKELLEDAPEPVAGEEEGEEAARPEAEAPLHHEQEFDDRRVPEQLVEERWMEAGVVLVAVPAEAGFDLERPRKAARRPYSSWLK